MKNAEGWDTERLECLANEIYQWLIEHKMWIDTAIYYNGKRLLSTNNVIEEADPRDYFEYVADEHILSMSFEGPLYYLLNHGYDGLEEEFNNIFKKHGLYYELGNAWNLTCYEE